MAGYSGTPLWKKLGLREGARALLIDAPAGWRIPDAPADVTIRRERGAARRGAGAENIIAFFCALAGVRESLPLLAQRIFPAGALWVAWPRRAGGHDSDIREQDIRDLALGLGLVDVKVAALDEDWSGLRLVWRRELRQSPPATRE
jgi:hypothetical protein